MCTATHTNLRNANVPRPTTPPHPFHPLRDRADTNHPPSTPRTPRGPSVLKRITFKRPCDSFVLLHLQRSHLPEWVRAMLAVALGVGPSQALPPIILQEPTDNTWAQVGARPPAPRAARPPLLAPARRAGASLQAGPPRSQRAA